MSVLKAKDIKDALTSEQIIELLEELGMTTNQMLNDVKNLLK